MSSRRYAWVTTIIVAGRIRRGLRQEDSAATATTASRSTGCSGTAATAAAAARGAAGSAAPPPRALTEEELFARKTLEQLNARRPLGDVLFDLDAATVREDQRGDPAEERRLPAALADDAGLGRKATPTRAAPTSTTWRWASAVPTPCATTWSAWGLPATGWCGEQGRGIAVVHRRDRRLLGTEPPRASSSSRQSNRHLRQAAGPHPAGPRPSPGLRVVHGHFHFQATVARPADPLQHLWPTP